MAGHFNEPETIDVLELMKGLDDDEDFVHLKHTPWAAASSKQATTSLYHPSETFILEPFDVKDQWLDSHPMRGVVGKSVATVTEGSSKDPLAYGKPQSIYGSTSGSTTPKSELLDVKQKVSTQETLAEHLQKSLSFETSPGKEMKRIFSQKNALHTYHSKGLTVSVEKDTSGFSCSRLPWERESVSSPSTPSFAGSVSLQKWFQDDARRLKQREQQRAQLIKAPESEPQFKQPVHDACPPLVSKVPVSTSSVVHETSPPRGPVTTSKATEGAYHNIHSSVAHDADLSATKHPYDLSKHQMPSGGLRQTKGEQQQGRVTRLRHSFTVGNHRKELSETKISPANNRSSSLELETVAVGPKVNIVLYSMTSRENIHAFEDSNAARTILASIVGSSFEERSVSEYAEHEQELKSAMNTQAAQVPTVCARGRYITGLDNIMQLYKKGQLRSLLAETTVPPSAPCVCRGGKFLICPVCKGRRKLARKQDDEDVQACRYCSGTGLIKCPNCPT